MAGICSSRSAMKIAITAFLLFAMPPAIALPFYTTLQLSPGTGSPKAVAFDLLEGGPYTGISDGTRRSATGGTANATVGLICGRPLGIAFNSSQFLYICDAYLGLYVVGPLGGRATRLASSAEGLPIRSCNGLDVDLNTGWVYFTDTSANYVLSNVSEAKMNRDSTGRLLRFDPTTRQVAVLARGLSGPGGVAVAIDSSYLLVTEFIGGTVKKFFLAGPRTNTIQTLLNVAGASTIRRTLAGEFTLTEMERPFTHRVLRIDGNGRVLVNVSLGGPYNNVSNVTGARISGLFVYIGSLYATFVGKVLGLGLALP